ncbi:MAG: hypothetical protein M3065_21920 [Actinomycetota bacterium]|nr:hypothetical protein [Actinomycetota bacterium]
MLARGRVWGAALAAYPVAWLVVSWLLGASSSAATGPPFVVLVVPGVVIGLLTGRWKALLIPAVEFSTLFLVGITGSPGCEDCGGGG